MSSRSTRAAKVDAAMELCGVVCSAGVSFGRPSLKGTGTPVHVPAGRFRGGDTIRAIAIDMRLTRQQVESALRFVMLYPKSDLPSFWEVPMTKT